MPKQTVWMHTVWHLQANRHRSGLLTIPVFLFGRTYTFLVDTGAGHSVIDRNIVDFHQLPLMQEVQWADVVGTRISSPRVRMPLQLGGKDGLEIIVTPLVVAIPPQHGFDGYMGADILRQYDVTLEEAMLVLGQRVTLR
jgi:hypothetical protein